MRGFMQFLVGANVVTPEQLESAVHQKNGDSLGRALIRLGYVNEETLLGRVHDQFAFPFVNPRKIEPCTEALRLIPVEICRKHVLLPVAMDDSHLTIATADPSDAVGVNAVKFLAGRTVRIALARSQEIRKALETHYNAHGRNYSEILARVGRGEAEVPREEPEPDLEQLRRSTEEAPIVRLVNAILRRAAERRASDVHIEPYQSAVRIRNRIDGVLHDVASIPVDIRHALVSRIKIIAGLDISERRLPQDGAFRIRVEGGEELSLRVSVVPTAFGEKVVLRFLEMSNVETDTTKLGFDEEGLRHFRRAIRQPHGMILVTGPTGSGKTTTLYSAIAELNDSVRNIATAEDPIEIRLDGVNQLQINEGIGLTFARALRAFLRQDPDVIMVGEIRDTETAEISIKAALTGHLVLSTLHTNDAPSAISRYLDMGAEPFLAASSIELVIAQRLARRICERCKTRVEYPESALAEVGLSSESLGETPLYRGAGCDDCDETGYSGRIALFEVMPTSAAIRELTLRRASADEIRGCAVSEGMRTLRQCGLVRLREGMTTVEEMLRVTTSGDFSERSYRK